MNTPTTSHPWRTELLHLLVLALPFAYLAYCWPSMTGEVPVHWNARGEIDRYGGRGEVLLAVSMVALLPYVLLRLAPLIDPRRANMALSSKAFGAMRLLISVVMSAIALVIVHSAHARELAAGDVLLPLLFLLLVGIGNFLPALRSNYFIGIRVPWTIESEANWRSTHRFAARLWFWGGLLGAVITFLLPTEEAKFTFFLPAFLSLAFIPIIHSYLYYRREQRQRT